MAKSIRDTSKKIETRGRKKTTGPGEAVMLRLHPPLLTNIDDWINKQEDTPSRPEAIRRLIEQALVMADTRPIGASEQQKAAEMASREIDKIDDLNATSEERAQRKRRLVKGPSELRGDRTKGKR
jgi:hypothetical protein